MHAVEHGRLPDGTPVHCIEIGSPPGLVARVLTLGATLHALEATRADGGRTDVTLSHPTVEDRLACDQYLGAVVGRYAGRIAGGRFDLDGRTVTVPTNDRGHALHGGTEGYDRRLWRLVETSADRVQLELVSPAGDMGFPGRLVARATYAVTGSALRLDLTATTDAPTVVGLSHHAYFNLDGPGHGTVDDHTLVVHADEYTPIDVDGIPVAGHRLVTGTPFDLRHPVRLGGLVRSAHPELRAARGLDHGFVLPGVGLRPAAALHSALSGLQLEVETTAPALHVYSGNYFDGSPAGPHGRSHRQGDGIALEPQYFADSPNHAEWPSAVLRPGQTHHRSIVWRVRTPCDPELAPDIGQRAGG